MTSPDGEGHDIRSVLAQLGLQLEHELLERALTHRSYAYEQGGLPTNERLEFLGDSVLGVVVTEHLYLTWPDMSEGQLAKLRAAVVNSRALATVARGLGLGELVLLGRGEETTGGRDKVSILADTTEAVIGAVFEQYGIESARVFVHRLFDPLMVRVSTLGAGLDWKTSLQELSSTAGLGVPVYDITESGPDHAKHFRAMVVLGLHRYGPGEGSNKKEAEQHAAETAFVALQSQLEQEAAAAAVAEDAAETVPGLNGADLDGAGLDGSGLDGAALDGAVLDAGLDGLASSTERVPSSASTPG